MKDIGKGNIFEFNHIDKSVSESDIKTLKDFYHFITRNTGVTRNHTNDIKH